MPRIVASGLLAIALLFLGSVVVLYRFGGGSRRPPPSATGFSPSPAAPGAARVTPPGAAPVAGAVAAQRSVPDAAPRRVAATQELMSPSRRHALVSFRREIMSGLAGLEQRIGRCAPKGPPARGGPSLEAMSFTLAVETVAGGVRITDVQLETRGAASDAEVACARSALRDHVIPAPSAEPGRRWRLRFSPGSGT